MDNNRDRKIKKDNEDDNNKYEGSDKNRKKMK